MSVGGTDSAVAEGDAAADDAEASALDPVVTMLPDIHAGRAFALSQLGKFKDAVSAATSAIKAGKAMEAAVCVVFFFFFFFLKLIYFFLQICPCHI
jgi:hypothetical protein